jgi:hypothetical protein
MRAFVLSNSIEHLAVFFLKLYDKTSFYWGSQHVKD